MKLIILIISIALWSSCNHSCTEEFSFEFPLSVTPKDTFNIGDTIWFEMQSSPKVLDVYSGEYYDISNIVTGFGFSIQKLDTNYVYNAALDFIYVSILGNVYSNVVYIGDINIKFKSKEERVFRFGIIPTKSGVFESAMTLLDEVYYLEMGEHKNNRLFIHSSPCNQYMYEYSSVVTNNGLTNRYLRDTNKCYQFSPTDTTSSCLGSNKVPLSGRGTFAFVVR